MTSSDPDNQHALQQRITELEATVAGLEGTSKMLISRDLELRKAYENLKSVDAQKSDFISIVAHQLRTPLTTARWAHKMLLEEVSMVSTEQRELLERSAASIEHMHQLVEDILELNHIEYGSFAISKKSHSLEQLLETICQELKTHSEAKSIKLKTVWADQSQAVAFDIMRLQEVCTNVIENAIKYSPAGGCVTITTAYTATEGIITVTNTGPGIPADKQAAIFQKFTRLEEAKKADPNGTGLGLYVAKKIIELHNGSIEVTSTPHSSTTFTITLPIT